MTFRQQEFAKKLSIPEPAAQKVIQSGELSGPCWQKAEWLLNNLKEQGVTGATIVGFKNFIGDKDSDFGHAGVKINNQVIWVNSGDGRGTEILDIKEESGHLPQHIIHGDGVFRVFEITSNPEALSSFIAVHNGLGSLLEHFVTCGDNKTEPDLNWLLQIKQYGQLYKNNILGTPDFNTEALNELTMMLQNATEVMLAMVANSQLPFNAQSVEGLPFHLMTFLRKTATDADRFNSEVLTLLEKSAGSGLQPSLDINLTDNLITEKFKNRHHFWQRYSSMVMSLVENGFALEPDISDSADASKNKEQLLKILEGQEEYLKEGLNFGK